MYHWISVLRDQMQVWELVGLVYFQLMTDSLTSSRGIPAPGSFICCAWFILTMMQTNVTVVSRLKVISLYFRNEQTFRFTKVATGQDAPGVGHQACVT